MILQERSSNMDPFMSKIQRKSKATSYEFIVKLLNILEVTFIITYRKDHDISVFRTLNMLGFLVGAPAANAFY